MKFVWLIVAGIAILLAAVFLWRGDFNSAFVVAAVGLVAWFLNYRSQLKEVTGESEIEKEDDIEDERQN